MRQHDAQSHKSQIFRWNHTRAGGFHEECKEDDRQHHQGRSQPSAADEEEGPQAVFAHDATIRHIVSLAHPSAQSLIISSWTHNNGAECRTESQGIDSRQAYSHGHRDSELGIELARYSTRESHRDEHNHEHQRAGEDGSGNALHSIVCGKIRR